MDVSMLDQRTKWFKGEMDKKRPMVKGDGNQWTREVQCGKGDNGSKKGK